MKIETHTVEGVLVIKPKGKITIALETKSCARPCTKRSNPARPSW